VATDPARWLIGHRHYSVAQVESLARGAGLEIERLHTRAGWWEIIHMNVMYVSKWVLRRPPLFERFLLSRLDQEWSGAEGFVHVFLDARKPR
jgi:hypothetical protein